MRDRNYSNDKNGEINGIYENIFEGKDGDMIDKISVAESNNADAKVDTSEVDALDVGIGMPRADVTGASSSDAEMRRQEIIRYLKIADSSRVLVFDEVDSTNSRARALAMRGAAEGTVVTADSQTSGRGRMGRKFESPGGKGIYLSIILRPEFSPQIALFTTTAAAVAVSEAIYEVTGKETGIKWVNDIYIDGKKICGILAEAELNPKTSQFDFVILGIGINFNTVNSDFSKSVIERGVGSIYENEIPAVSREQLAAAIIDKVVYYCTDSTADMSAAASLRQRTEEIISGVNSDCSSSGASSEVVSSDASSKEKISDMNSDYSSSDASSNKDNKKQRVLEKYRALSIVVGRKIRCIRGDEEWIATAEGIGGNGELLIAREDGRRDILSSGEISIRPFG